MSRSRIERKSRFIICQILLLIKPSTQNSRIPRKSQPIELFFPNVTIKNVTTLVRNIKHDFHLILLLRKYLRRNVLQFNSQLVTNELTIRSIPKRLCAHISLHVVI